MPYVKRKRTRSLRRRRAYRPRRSFKRRRFSKKARRRRRSKYQTLNFRVTNEIMDAFRIDSDQGAQFDVHNFRLEHLENFDTWKSLYEEVRVNYIVVKYKSIRATVNTSTVGVDSTSINPFYETPTVYYRKDYSDAQLPTGLNYNEMEDYFRKAPCGKTTMNKSLKMILKPRLQNLNFVRPDPEGGPAPVTMTTPTRPGQWMQLNNPETLVTDLIPWIKLCTTQDAVNGRFRWEFDATYSVSFRGRRN